MQDSIAHIQLHWLDVPDRVLFKLAVRVHQCPKAAHHRICRSTASRSPVLTRGGICVPPTVTLAVPRFRLNTYYDRTSGVISCWRDGLELTPGFYQGSNDRAAQTVLKRICSRVTSASSAFLTIMRYRNPRTHSHYATQ